MRQFMIITMDQLVSLGACDSARSLFALEFGERLEIPEYMAQQQEWLVRSEWRRYLGRGCQGTRRQCLAWDYRS